MGKSKGGTGLAVAAAAGIWLAMSHSGHHHGGIPILDSFGAAPVHGGRQVVAFARHQLGCTYTWGGTGPCSSGFDCSGLATKAWASAGVTIPRTSELESAQLHHVSRRQLRPGDLVFSYWDVDSQASPNHVQIYVGHGDVIGADTTDVERTPLSADAGHITGYADPGER